jgi:hypothetical protein
MPETARPATAMSQKNLSLSIHNRSHYEISGYHSNEILEHSALHGLGRDRGSKQFRVSSVRAHNTCILKWLAQV